MDDSVIEIAEKQAALCRMLGSARRLIILWLISQGELSVNDIAERVGSSVQNISQHLGLLKRSGFVIARRDGQTIYYHLADDEYLKQCPALQRAAEILK
ncbi:MAG: metalloregulator ArsR/SmtB family transcription factor [Anaerolineales bacterium]|nr:metalloregulator ArsR/SmtB family transcription factor [Anaerolineales bacterium]